MTAGQLADRFEQSASTMSGHFSTLKTADLIQADRTGTTITYRLNITVVQEAAMQLMNAFSVEAKLK